jgi:hypothetical protein
MAPRELCYSCSPRLLAASVLVLLSSLPQIHAALSGLTYAPYTASSRQAGILSRPIYG